MVHLSRRFWTLAIVVIAVSAHNLSAQQITWTTLSLPVAAADRYDDIFFISPQIGWAIDGGEQQGQIIPINGRIYKTIDGGSSWTLQFGGSINYLRSIRFVDSLHGWAGTLGIDSSDPTPDTALLYETIDGGTTWFVADSKIEGTKPAGLCGIFAVDTDNIYICGKYTGPAYILKTTNNGKSWQSIDMNSYASRLIDIYFWSRDSGIVVGGIGSEYDTGSAGSDYGFAIILFTSDGGNTWSTRYQSDTIDGWCWKISFPTHNIGYVSIEDAGIATPFLTTTDGGMTWVKRLASSSPGDLEGVGFIKEKLGWLGGWNNSVLSTTDGGNSWTQTKDGPNANRFRFFGDTLAYCAGEQVYKITVTWPEAVNSSNENTQLSAQNYPNPFGDFTEIHFTLPNEEHVTLTLYDLEGNKLLDVLDGTYSAGEHNVPCFDPENSSIPSGTYIYELTAGGCSIERQMIRLR
jgi:photosystem II stability/assembly factor-like uncharacterized protein